MKHEVEHVVVVGAGLGGVRTVEQLRSQGHRGPVTLVGAETHLPYDRPPLSKQVLTGAWEPARATLRDQAALDELGVDLRLGVRAVGLSGTTVELDDGTAVVGDAVVLATGVVPRRLPGQPAGVPTLRTLEDALALKQSFATISSLLVVGAGFIGAEVAWAAVRAGVSVTVLEALDVPCERALGAQAGELAARLFVEGGVDLRCRTRISRFLDDHTVELEDGSELRADQVLVGIGAVPDVAWLDAAGLDTSDGVACDARGRVLGTSGVWGVGDLAAWWDADRARFHRSEHWTGTADQAVVVAGDVLGHRPPAAAVPYAWSDQFGLKIQSYGRTDLGTEVVELHGEGLRGGPVKGTVVGYFAGDVLVGVVGFGAPVKLMPYRALVARRAARAEVHPAEPVTR